MEMKTIEKNAWIILFGLGMIGLVFGLQSAFMPSPDAQATENFTGMTWEAIQSNNSGMADLVKFIYLALGIMMFGYFLLYLAIVSVGYRKGETWTWYASWTLPLMLIAFTIGNNRGHGGEWPMFIVLLIVSLLGLLLPTRKFFPRKSSVKS